MAIPDFQSLMLPLLDCLSEGRELTMRDVTARLADHFRLSDDERQQLLPSGQNRLFANRVAWAKAHLKAAGLLDNPSRGKVRLSAEGRKGLDQKPDGITCGFLRKYPSYLAVNGRFKTSHLWALQNQPGVRCSRSTVLPIAGLTCDQLTTRSW